MDCGVKNEKIGAIKSNYERAELQRQFYSKNPSTKTSRKESFSRCRTTRKNYETAVTHTNVLICVYFRENYNNNTRLAGTTVENKGKLILTHVCSNIEGEHAVA